MKHAAIAHTARAFLAAAIAAALLFAATAQSAFAASFEDKLAALEASSNGRLGVAAMNAETGATVHYRSGERFPFASTFKVMLAAAALKRSETRPAFIKKRLFYTQKDLVAWSPIAEKRTATGMTVWELCDAAVRYSDNTAANLLMRELGGPRAVTAFARSIGDESFSLNRWEPELNSAEPGDERDTTTPAAMANSLRVLVLGNALAQVQRDLLADWLKNNTTGDDSIRAGVPPGWIVGDKTGGGSYGTTNDVAVMWPPDGGPIVAAVYFTQKEKSAPLRRDVAADAARIIVEALRQ